MHLSGLASDEDRLFSTKIPCSIRRAAVRRDHHRVDEVVEGVAVQRLRRNGMRRANELRFKNLFHSGMVVGVTIGAALAVRFRIRRHVIIDAPSIPNMEDRG